MTDNADEISQYVRDYKDWLTRQRELAAMIAVSTGDIELPRMVDIEPPPLPLLRAAEKITAIWYDNTDEVPMELLATAIDLFDQALADYRKEYGRVN